MSSWVVNALEVSPSSQPSGLFYSGVSHHLSFVCHNWGFWSSIVLIDRECALNESETVSSFIFPAHPIFELTLCAILHAKSIWLWPVVMVVIAVIEFTCGWWVSCSMCWTEWCKAEIARSIAAICSCEGVTVHWICWKSLVLFSVRIRPGISAWFGFNSRWQSERYQIKIVARQAWLTACASVIFARFERHAALQSSRALFATINVSRVPSRASYYTGCLLNACRVVFLFLCSRVSTCAVLIAP